jgi:hypothetical protein
MKYLADEWYSFSKMNTAFLSGTPFEEFAALKKL